MHVFPRRNVPAAVLAFFLVAGSLFAQTKPGPSLEPGSTVSDVLDLRNRAPVTYRLEIAEDVFGIRIALADSPADLDIYLTDRWGDVYYFSETEDYNESIYLSKLTDPPLQAGTYTVEVLYQLPKEPVVDGRQVSEIPYTLRFEAIRPRFDGPLEADVPYTASLSPAEGMLITYRVEVPAGTRRFRVDLFDTVADLDIFINYGSPVVSPWDADYSSQSLLSRERIVVDAATEGRRFLPSGAYYVTVIDQISAEEETPFGIVWSPSDRPAGFLLDVPPLSIPDSPLEQALLATVEIVGQSGAGSGCIVSQDGYILTNWHVVRGPSGRPDRALVVSVSIDHSRPPRELYLAEVVDYDADRDLALLQITGGLYGQPLPADYRFPVIRLADGGLPPIGEELRFVGYPGIGGTGSRVSVTLTRGIVSGYQATGFGTIIKTDGEINEGNSGGAALNRDLRLVGLPTQIVGRDAGQLGFVHPVSLIPRPWLDRIRGR